MPETTLYKLSNLEYYQLTNYDFKCFVFVFTLSTRRREIHPTNYITILPGVIKWSEEGLIRRNFSDKSISILM